MEASWTVPVQSGGAKPRPQGAGDGDARAPVAREPAASRPLMCPKPMETRRWQESGPPVPVVSGRSPSVSRRSAVLAQKAIYTVIVVIIGVAWRWRSCRRLQRFSAAAVSMSCPTRGATSRSRVYRGYGSGATARDRRSSVYAAVSISRVLVGSVTTVPGRCTELGTRARLNGVHHGSVGGPDVLAGPVGGGAGGSRAARCRG